MDVRSELNKRLDAELTIFNEVTEPVAIDASIGRLKELELQLDAVRDVWGKCRPVRIGGGVVA